jgi:hypothetical protein
MYNSEVQDLVKKATVFLKEHRLDYNGRPERPKGERSTDLLNRVIFTPMGGKVRVK